MSKLTISEASRLAQISRTTMYKKYIQSGKISVIKEDDKSFIDVSELLRVFPDLKMNEPQVDTDIEQPKTQINNHIEQLLQAKDDMINMLKEQLADYKKEVGHLREIELKFIEDKTPKKRKKFLGIF